MKIGGKERELRFTFRALKAIETETGVNLLQGEMEDVMSDLDKTVHMVCAALQHEDPPPSLDEIWDGLEWGDMPEIAVEIMLCARKDLTREDARTRVREAMDRATAPVEGADPARPPKPAGTKPGA